MSGISNALEFFALGFSQLIGTQKKETNSNGNAFF